MMGPVKINERLIGRGHPVYIVAEMSGNHNQDYDRAVEIIREAKRAGVDAVKLQTYTADTITLDSDAEPFQVKGNIWDGIPSITYIKRPIHLGSGNQNLKQLQTKLALVSSQLRLIFPPSIFLRIWGLMYIKLPLLNWLIWL